MKIKIVTDSSANLYTLDGADFSPVPLKVLADGREYVDNAELDVPKMLRELKEYKGKSSTACPSVGDWLEAFDDADVVYGSAITSHLSGCYNAAAIAAEEYRARFPERKVFILDTLSTGPEMELITEKYRELVEAGLDFEQVCREIRAYRQRTHLMFSLESLSNFAKNGRVSPALAAAVGILGIRIVGKASDLGDLEPMHKCRGEKRAISKIWECMKELGYRGGKVRLRHSYNLEAAEKLAELIRDEYPHCDLKLGPNRGLCCFYAEEGGLLVGFET